LKIQKSEEVLHFTQHHHHQAVTCFAKQSRFFWN